MTATLTERVVPREAATYKKSGMLLAAAVMALAVGFGSIAGGAFGAWYTWDQAATQGIVTPDDAVFPGVDVRGPLSMWAQADIITHHQLDSTGGLYYAEMDREVAAVDEAGQPVLDENGQPVMVPNEARASWITATALTTALSLGVLSYALSAVAVAFGTALVLIGFVFLRIRSRAVFI